MLRDIDLQLHKIRGKPAICLTCKPGNWERRKRADWKLNKCKAWLLAGVSTRDHFHYKIIWEKQILLRKLRNMDFMVQLLVKYAGYVTSKRPEMQTLHHSTKHGCFSAHKAPICRYIPYSCSAVGSNTTGNFKLNTSSNGEVYEFRETELNSHLDLSLKRNARSTA